MNTRDIKFVIKEWLDMKTLLSLDAYKEYYGCLLYTSDAADE